MPGLSLVAASGGHSSSRCAGLSLSRPLLLRSTGSRCAGSVVVAHGPSCSAARGIFPDQGSNPCPLHWQADSQPLRHQGSPASPFVKQGRRPHWPTSSLGAQQGQGACSCSPSFLSAAFPLPVVFLSERSCMLCTHRSSAENSPFSETSRWGVLPPRGHAAGFRPAHWPSEEHEGQATRAGERIWGSLRACF